MGGSDIHYSLDQRQHRGMQRREARGEVRAAPIHGERVLHEIVGANAEERNIVDEGVHRQRSGRRLHHHSQHNIVPVRDAPGNQLSRRFVKEMLCLLHLIERYDERKHDSDASVHRRSEKCAELGLEQLGLIETHPDRAPAEERVGIGGIAANRKLVAAHIERADHNRSTTEGFDDVLIRAILLFLVGHRRAANDQKFGAHQPHTLCAAVRGELRFLGQIDVGAQRHPVAVERYGFGGGECLQLLVLYGLDRAPVAVRLDLAGGRVDDEYARGAVEDDVFVSVQDLRRVTQTYDSGKAEGSRENRDVRRSRSRVSGDSDDCLAIELHGQARSPIVRDEDLVGSFGQIDRIVIGKAEQYRQNPDVDIDQIAHSLAQHRSRVSRELLAPLEQHQVESFFGAEVLMNELLYLPQQLSFLEDRQLHVEVCRLFRSGVLLGARAYLPQPRAGLFERVVEPFDLGGNRLVENDAVPDVRHFPAQQGHGAVNDSGRSRHPGEGLRPQRSPNLLAITVDNASSAASASSPTARRMTVAPNSAASIITPMMLFALTSRSSRMMVMLLLNLPAVFTISAAGRAWIPSLLTIFTSRSGIRSVPSRVRIRPELRERCAILRRAREAVREAEFQSTTPG